MKQNEIYEKIKDIYMEKTNEELAKLCNVSLSTIKRTMKKYGLSRNLVHNWTDEEINYLIAHVDTQTNGEIAEALGLTIDTVKMKVRKDKIKRKKFKADVDTIDNEVWKIISFATNYSVSNMGRIKNNNENYLIQQYTTQFGYKQVSLVENNGERHPHRVHRIVATHFIDNTDSKPEVNHKDGNKTNNFVENLEWVTSSENKIHAYNNGLMSPPPIETIIHTENSEDDIRKVCQMLQDGKNYDEILKATGINKNIISQIKRRKTWNNISKDYKF